jgi:hypothetical protein
MARFLFAPLSIVAGLIAGALARKLSDSLWGLFDDKEAPEPEHADAPWSKLLFSMALEGAVFATVRGAVDHVARSQFARATGVWPGEDKRERT